MSIYIHVIYLKTKRVSRNTKHDIKMDGRGHIFSEALARSPGRWSPAFRRRPAYGRSLSALCESWAAVAALAAVGCFVGYFSEAYGTTLNLLLGISIWVEIFHREEALLGYCVFCLWKKTSARCVPFLGLSQIWEHRNSVLMSLRWQD